MRRPREHVMYHLGNTSSKAFFITAMLNFRANEKDFWKATIKILTWND